jgi:hypothetical protein
MADPVSWLEIGQGWSVVGSDGVAVGTVAQVEGDKQGDIFDGLAVESGDPPGLRYVPGEQVGAIVEGEVSLKVASGDFADFQPFETPPPETIWRPAKPTLASRLSRWLRGR